MKKTNVLTLGTMLLVRAFFNSVSGRQMPRPTQHISALGNTCRFFFLYMLDRGKKTGNIDDIISDGKMLHMTQGQPLCHFFKGKKDDCQGHVSVLTNKNFCLKIFLT